MKSKVSGLGQMFLFPFWPCIKWSFMSLNNLPLPLKYCSTLQRERVKFACILLSLLSNLQPVFNMVALTSFTLPSFSPSSRCLAPVCPPALWCSCLRWTWAFHGNGTPHEDRSKLVLSLQHQGTKYLIWSRSPGKSYCWTGTGHWGGGRVEKHFFTLRILHRDKHTTTQVPDVLLASVCDH